MDHFNNNNNDVNNKKKNQEFALSKSGDKSLEQIRSDSQKFIPGKKSEEVLHNRPPSPKLQEFHQHARLFDPSYQIETSPHSITRKDSLKRLRSLSMQIDEKDLKILKQEPISMDIDTDDTTSQEYPYYAPRKEINISQFQTLFGQDSNITSHPSSRRNTDETQVSKTSYLSGATFEHPDIFSDNATVPTKSFTTSIPRETVELSATAYSEPLPQVSNDRLSSISHVEGFDGNMAEHSIPSDDSMNVDSKLPTLEQQLTDLGHSHETADELYKLGDRLKGILRDQIEIRKKELENNIIDNIIRRIKNKKEVYSNTDEYSYAKYTSLNAKMDLQLQYQVLDNYCNGKDKDIRKVIYTIGDMRRHGKYSHEDFQFISSLKSEIENTGSIVKNLEFLKFKFKLAFYQAEIEIYPEKLKKQLFEQVRQKIEGTDILTYKDNPPLNDNNSSYSFSTPYTHNTSLIDPTTMRDSTQEQLSGQDFGRNLMDTDTQLPTLERQLQDLGYHEISAIIENLEKIGDIIKAIPQKEIDALYQLLAKEMISIVKKRIKFNKPIYEDEDKYLYAKHTHLKRKNLFQLRLRVLEKYHNGIDHDIRKVLVALDDDKSLSYNYLFFHDLYDKICSIIENKEFKLLSSRFKVYLKMSKVEVYTEDDKKYFFEQICQKTHETSSPNYNDNLLPSNDNSSATTAKTLDSTPKQTSGQNFGASLMDIDRNLPTLEQQLENLEFTENSSKADIIGKIVENIPQSQINTCRDELNNIINKTHEKIIADQEKNDLPLIHLMSLQDQYQILKDYRNSSNTNTKDVLAALQEIKYNFYSLKAFPTIDLPNNLNEVTEILGSDHELKRSSEQSFPDIQEEEKLKQIIQIVTDIPDNYIESCKRDIRNHINELSRKNIATEIDNEKLINTLNSLDREYEILENYRNKLDPDIRKVIISLQLMRHNLKSLPTSFIPDSLQNEVNQVTEILGSEYELRRISTQFFADFQNARIIVHPEVFYPMDLSFDNASFNLNIPKEVDALSSKMGSIVLSDIPSTAAFTDLTHLSSSLDDNIDVFTSTERIHALLDQHRKLLKYPLADVLNHIKSLDITKIKRKDFIKENQESSKKRSAFIKIQNMSLRVNRDFDEENQRLRQDQYKFAEKWDSTLSIAQGLINRKTRQENLTDRARDAVIRVEKQFSENLARLNHMAQQLTEAEIKANLIRQPGKALENFNALKDRLTIIDDLASLARYLAKRANGANEMLKQQDYDWTEEFTKRYPEKAKHLIDIVARYYKEEAETAQLLLPSREEITGSKKEGAITAYKDRSYAKDVGEFFFDIALQSSKNFPDRSDDRKFIPTKDQVQQLAERFNDSNSEQIAKWAQEVRTLLKAEKSRTYTIFNDKLLFDIKRFADKDVEDAEIVVAEAKFLTQEARRYVEIAENFLGELKLIKDGNALREKNAEIQSNYKNSAINIKSYYKQIREQQMQIQELYKQKETLYSEIPQNEETLEKTGKTFLKEDSLESTAIGYNSSFYKSGENELTVVEYSDKHEFTEEDDLDLLRVSSTELSKVTELSKALECLIINTESEIDAIMKNG